MIRTVLVIGECMVEMAPRDGEAGSYRIGFAGDTFNTAWHLRRLLPGDHAIRYFTTVGDDATSRDMLGFMQSAGIETDHIRRIRDRRPGLYMIRHENGSHAFSYWRDTSAARLLADDEGALAAAFDGAGTVFLSGITLAILDEAGRRRLFGAVERSGADLVFDPNIRLGLWPDRDVARSAISQAAALARTVLPSFGDEQALFGDATPGETIARYHALGVREVVVKDGGNPVWISAGGAIAPLAPPPPERPVVDATGAGDAFNAGYLAGRLTGDSPTGATARGHRVAGQVISVQGALLTGTEGGPAC